jgi:hypothetical protein
MAQVVECLPSKHKALSSTPRTTNKTKTKKHQNFKKKKKGSALPEVTEREE